MSVLLQTDFGLLKTCKTFNLFPSHPFSVSDPQFTPLFSKIQNECVDKIKDLSIGHVRASSVFYIVADCIVTSDNFNSFTQKMQDASESSVTAAVVQNEIEVKNTEISAQDRYDCATSEEASPLQRFH